MSTVHRRSASVGAYEQLSTRDTAISRSCQYPHSFGATPLNHPATEPHRRTHARLGAALEPLLSNHFTSPHFFARNVLSLCP